MSVAMKTKSKTSSLPKLSPPKHRRANEQPYAQAHVDPLLWETILEVMGDYTRREIIEWGLKAWLLKKDPQAANKLGIYAESL